MPKTEQYPGLDRFMKKHCRSRQYTFQVKKCTEKDCWFCVLNPPRLPAEVFAELSWLPDPVLSEGDTDANYKDFREVYGKETTDCHRPGLAVKPQPTENDKRHRKLLTGQKTRQFVICCECGKRRVVYSAHKLNPHQEFILQRLQGELVYVCGNILIADGLNMDVMIVREGLFGDVTVKFDAVCFFCDDSDIFEGYLVTSLRKQYGIVRPICSSCVTAGKQPATRNAVKVGKRKHSK